MTAPMIEPAALNAEEAAQYLGVGRTHFYVHIRPTLPTIDMKAPHARRPMWRWRKTDLDVYLTYRTIT